jgi:hypothetical protein
VEFEILPPNPSSLVASLRSVGYSLETAIADVIDNSITAQAHNISVWYSWNEGSPWIVLDDDGHGMGPETLVEAMRLGSKHPNEKREARDLGRFGLGLKTASFSQCNQLTVLSYWAGHVSGREWDLAQIDSEPDKGWRLKILDSFDIERISLNDKFLHKVLNGFSGTSVIWRNLDLASGSESNFNECMSVVRNHLSLVFHRYLVSEKGSKAISMKLNNIKLEPHDPFNLKNLATRELPLQPIVIDGQKLKVEAYILPHHSKVSKEDYEKFGMSEGYSQNQGFYVYRNRRLIIRNTWFRLVRKEQLTKLIRVKIDIPNTLDKHWRIDVKKSTANPPEAVRAKLKTLMPEIRTAGSSVYRAKGSRIKTKELHPIWTRVAANGKIEYEINRSHPLTAKLLEETNDLKSLLKMIEASFPKDTYFFDLANNPKELSSNNISDANLEEYLDLFLGEFKLQGLNGNELSGAVLECQPFSKVLERTKKIFDKKGIIYES